MKSWTTLILAAAVAIPAAAPLAAAGSKPAPTPPPSAEKSPQEMADEAYNQGLELRDKAWALEAKAEAAGSEAERRKLLAKAGKQHEKSIPLFLNATERAPLFHQAFSSLGYAYRKTGDFEAALEAYDRALELAPDYGEAIEYRAEAYLGLDRVDDAKKAYMKLFNLDRALADELMGAMERWVETRRAEPGGVASETIDELAAWLAERSELAEQTARLTAAAERSWGD